VAEVRGQFGNQVEGEHRLWKPLAEDCGRHRRLRILDACHSELWTM
jgi:hypothetical protein